MPKALDLFWEWGKPVDPLNRQILTCNLCGKRMTGGISRPKYHLAQIAGHDVGPCKETTQKSLLRPHKRLRALG